MKVLLAYRAPDDVADDPEAAALPSGLPLLAARVREDGHAPLIANFSRLPWKQVERYLASASPEVVGISCFTFNRHAAVRLARIARRTCPGAVVLMGGPHAAALPTLLLSRVREIDGIAVGEGEEPLAVACRRASLAEPLDGVPGLATRRGPVAAAPPAPMKGVRSVPGLAGAGLEPRRDLRHVVASRTRGGAIERRPPGDVATDLQDLRDDFGLVEFALVGNGLLDPAWLAVLAEALRERRVAVELELPGDPGDFTAHRHGDEFERALLAAGAAGLRRVRFVLDDDRAASLPPGALAEASGILRACGVASELVLRAGGLGENLGSRWLDAMRHVARALRPLSGRVVARELLPGTEEWKLASEDEGLDDSYWMDEDRSTIPLASEAALERGAAALDVVFREVAREAQPGPRDLDALESRAEPAWAHLSWGDFRASHGDAAEAERRYRLAAQDEPWNPFPWLKLAALFRRGRGDRAREAAALEQVLHRVPRHAAARERLDEIQRLAQRGRQRTARRDR